MEVSRVRQALFLFSMMLVTICWVFSIGAFKEAYGSMIMVFYTCVSGFSLIITLESIVYKTKPKKENQN